MYALGEKDQQRFREFLTSVPPERLEGEAALLRVLADAPPNRIKRGWSMRWFRRSAKSPRPLRPLR